MQPGIAALFACAAREAKRATTFDLGFALGPRLNAAGRLSDMSVGIECLLTDDPIHANKLAQQLDQLNRERRQIEAEMQDAASAHLENINPGSQASLVLYQPDWHQGVIGIVAGRIKEKFHRPTLAFARGGEGTLKGSGRSIPGIHLRDALDLVTKHHPELILKFGGHAMAAGLTIREADFETFAQSFESVVRHLATPAMLTRTLETDGPLDPRYYTLEVARQLEQEVWGQGFPAPLFSDQFQVQQQRLLKERHLKLQLNQHGQFYEAIQFNRAEPAPNTIHAAFRLSVNEYNGQSRLQLMLEHFN
jgi:single-stranded-DNA-specific exonuclease